MEADQPVVERVALGRAEPVSDAKLFRIPYLTYGGNDPRALYGNGLFVFTQFDWYYSDASILEGAAAAGPDWAAYNGAAVYVPKTDGTRSPVRERLFITASPRWRGLRTSRTRLRPCAGTVRPALAREEWGGPQGRDRRGPGLGTTDWRRSRFATTRIAGATPAKLHIPPAGRTRARRRPGTQDFVAAVQSLDWRVGLYTNYTDYAPVNSYWSEDWVARHPNGDWQHAWMRCYAPKPMRSVEMEALLAPQIQAKFGENHSYCDVHTAVTPFSRVDYDHRVPGAGTFRRTFECFGRLLYNEKTAHRARSTPEATTTVVLRA